MNNLKQLQLAWFMYAGDNNERLVPNGTGDQIGWVQGWLMTPRRTGTDGFFVSVLKKA